MDDEARAQRARQRAGYPGRVVRLGDEKPGLYADLTLLERLQRQTALVERMAALAGYPARSIPRAEWPGEVFEIVSSRDRSGR